MTHNDYASKYRLLTNPTVILNPTETEELTLCPALNTTFLHMEATHVITLY